ncbi:MAG: nitroreductase family protein [Synergistaceae bacterium]|nr:nitroreductase family protein [Synergistaceae bacterium]
MNLTEIIKTRRSVRNFDGRALSESDKEKLSAYVKTIRNPYDIPVEFVLLEAKEYGLSSPVIAGEKFYIAGKTANVPHSEEAFGFSFEAMILYAWSLGIGTTWIGGTLDRNIFNKAAGTKDNEIMYCVSPLGYPSEKMSDMEAKFRKMLNADKRKPESELFFAKNFGVPLELNALDAKTAGALQAVRSAPSAVNKQPWRIIMDGNTFHFYEEHSKELASHGSWDVQKIDMGIAVQHFMSIAGGKLVIENPGIATSNNDIEYIVTVVI